MSKIRSFIKTLGLTVRHPLNHLPEMYFIKAECKKCDWNETHRYFPISLEVDRDSYKEVLVYLRDQHDQHRLRSNGKYCSEPIDFEPRQEDTT